MNSSILRKANLLFLMLFSAFFAQAQTPAMKLKLQLISENKWGVYVKPEADITTGQTITIGGDQVTVVMPKNYAWHHLVSVNGNWASNAHVDGPIENPAKSYISFGFVFEAPPIPYQKDVETLLFTFEGDGTCPDSMYLIDNTTDPFSISPNSLNSNPQNEFGVFDMITWNAFTYSGNYAPSAWSCKDNDGDGILNALEDTNGNGIYDAGVDASNLNSACDVVFTLDPQDAIVCSGNDTTFTATASTPHGSFSFGWYYSDDNGVTVDSIDFTTMAAIYAHSITGQVTSGTDVLTVKNVAYQWGRRFWAVAHTQGCNDVYSNYAVLSVEGPFSVNTNPVSVVECAGNPTTFSGSFNNPGVPGSTIYHWQVSDDGGATWASAPNVLPFNGVGTSTLSIANVAGLHGYQFRLSARTGTCSIMYSAPALLTVEGPITVTQQPQTVDLCAGEPTSFTSTAHVGTSGSLIYQWQVSSDDTTWTDIDATTVGGVYSGETTTTLNVSSTTGLYTRSYRLAFSTAECGRVYSDPANMNIDGPIAIVGHPQDVIQCSGEGVFFGAKATTGSLETNGTGWIQYQWEESTGDTINGWKDLVTDTLYNGTNTDTLSIAYTSNLGGNYYRMKIWTDNCDTMYSYAALLDVEGPMVVTQEPSNVTVCSGSGTTFHSTVFLQNGDPNTFVYQWEVSQFNQGTGTWGAYNNLTDSGVFSGATTNTLNISDVAGMYNWRFRMRFRTLNCNPTWSNYAQLTVEGPLTITSQPQDVVECSGNPAVFCITVQNGGQSNTQYQWQVLNPGTDPSILSNWIDLVNNSIYNGLHSPCMSISNVVDLNDFQFRCKIQTYNCSTIFSDIAFLHVEGPITIDDQPQNVTICSNKPYLFNTTISNPGYGSMTYRWQYKKPNGDWANFPSNIGNLTSYPLLVINPTDPQAKFQGAFGQDLNFTNVNGLNGWKFRLAIMMPHCNTTTDEAMITVLDKCSGTCDLDNDGFTNEIDDDDDNDSLSDYWEEWMTNANITDDWNYMDANGNPLIFDPCSDDSDGDGLSDDVEDTDGDGISNEEETNGNGVFDGNPLDPLNPIAYPIFISQQPPISPSICSNISYQFNTTVAVLEPSLTTFTWQRSVDGGATWVSFPSDEGSNAPYNDGEYQGAFSDDLRFTLTEGMDSHQFRLIVIAPQEADTTTISTLHVLDACSEGTCDFDLDGTPNNMDVSGINCGTACIRLKLQLLPDSSGWAVIAKPQNGYSPTVNNSLSAGKITIVTPKDFSLNGLENGLGNWNLTNVITSPAGHPNRRYHTLDLTPNGSNLALNAGETMLFQFDKNGPCPDSLYILESSIPGISPNELLGQDLSFSGGFEYCGVYARKAWRCFGPDLPGGPIFDTGSEGLTGSPQSGTDKLHQDFSEGKKPKATADQGFTLAPNPAGDFVNIFVSKNFAEGQNTLTLWDLQGKKLREISLENTTAQLDLSGLAAGVYLVSLAQNGQVVERKKLVKQ